MGTRSYIRRSFRPKRVRSGLALLEGLIEEFEQAPTPRLKLAKLQHISQQSLYLPDGLLYRLAGSALRDPDFTIRGEMCYGLGLTGRPQFIPLIQRLLEDREPYVRKEAEKALAKLEQAAREQVEVLLSARSDLQEQIARLTDEVALLRQVLREALPRLARPVPDHTRQVLDEFERNHRAYEREEPQLLAEHRGEFAAVCDGEIVAVGPDEAQVLQEALRLKPAARPYIRKIGEQLPVRRRSR